MKEHILCFGAHPDDIELGCGGTIAKLVNQGHKIVHAILTSGEAGALETPPEELARVREEEAQASARILGTSEVQFLRYRDGLMHPTREMKIKVIRLIREIRPDTIFVHGRDDRFPDHRITHELVMAAIEAASGPWYSEPGGAPHTATRVLGYEVWNPIAQPGVFIDISNTLEKKLKALRAHESQLQTIPYDDAAQGLARYRGTMSRQGCFAEAFEVLRSGGFSC
ncbi:MAG: hypothetical protein RJB38_1569 [Pseudomonadota bacterium]|jgi:LmbE family N-acetylglucosaminyl deacetylase